MRPDTQILRRWAPEVLMLSIGGGMFLALWSALGRSATLALLLALALVPVQFAIIRAVDRHEPEPMRRLVRVFLWGGFIAIPLASAGIAAVDLIRDALDRPELSQGVRNVILAPVFEELAKGFALVLVLRRSRSDLDGLLDGIIYAMAVGFGFAFMENIVYYTGAIASEGFRAGLQEFILRGMLGAFMHPIYTSVLGLTIGIVALKHYRGLRARLYVAAGMLGSIGLHMMWNLVANAGDIGTDDGSKAVAIAALIVILAANVLVIVTLRSYAVSRERAGTSSS
jgi:RsiW-degrading membrane proteinase PrsW (M82 family)